MILQCLAGCVMLTAAMAAGDLGGRWERLPNLPDREGFAGSFAGVSHHALIVAGGSNFPEKRPWEGGRKIWYDGIYVLPHPGATWIAGPRLPQPNAYGVSVSTADAMICIGGGNADRHFREVFSIQWSDGRIVTTPLPDLPEPCAFMCGAMVGKTIYIAGGLRNPQDAACMKTFWALDLDKPGSPWQILPPCPGAERMLAAAGAMEGAFYLFSGARLFAGEDGKARREYLRDAWRYTAGRGWTRLADLPRAAVAAPSPAPALAGSRLLIVSGDDGAHVGFKPETQHPGFPRTLLIYDVRNNSWNESATSPISRATAPCVKWDRRIVIPGGEARPGYRSPEVWSFQDDGDGGGSASR